MRKPNLCFCSLALFIGATDGAVCQTTARIRTEQTSLELQAQPASSQIVSLGMGREKIWVNDAPERFIDSLEIEGRSVKLDWKLNSQASRIDGHEIAFVYESASPKLRLTCEWKASGSTGPIEHTIHIENLEAKELWIPLQDSFQFKWRVDKKAALEHFYVEKGAGSPSAVGTHETALPVGYRWNGTSSTYARPSKDEPREI